MLPNLGTTAAQFEELLAPKGSNQCFPVFEPRFPSSTVRASRSQTLEPMLPNLGTTAAQFEELLAPKGPNQCFPVLEPRFPSSTVGASRSQTLEPMLHNLGTTGSQLEELLVPKGSNECFPVLEPRVSSSSNWWWSPQEPMLHNLGFSVRGEPRAHSSRSWCSTCWNQCSPSLELRVSSWNCQLFPSLEPWGPSSMKPLLNLRELHFSRFVNYASQRDMCLIFDTFSEKVWCFQLKAVWVFEIGLEGVWECASAPRLVVVERSSCLQVTDPILWQVPSQAGGCGSPTPLASLRSVTTARWSWEGSTRGPACLMPVMP